jgi:hypothetical protein
MDWTCTKTAVADSGAEVCLMSERMYEELILAGLPTLKLPIEVSILVTALGTGSKRIKKQVLLHFSLGTDEFEQNYLVCSQLIGPVILDANSLSEYGIVLDFKEQSLHYEMGGEMRKQPFDRFQEADSEASNSEVAKNCVVRHTGHTYVVPPLKDTLSSPLPYFHWRPFLTASLERETIQFVHKSLGHQGVDKSVAHLARTFHVEENPFQFADIREFSPIRNPQSNLAELVTRDIGKFCKIYCHEKPRVWAELIPFIERWLHTTIGG